uniref:Uncharacterized protein n=1 Tax=Setaria digitata TaxID=48799 RepID=A0A915PK54_9BILA
MDDGNLSNLWKILQAEEATGVKCFDPERKNFYISESGFCVYGISYDLIDDVFYFDEKLYVNHELSHEDSDIALAEFEKAAGPLCEETEKHFDARNAVSYYGVWVKTKNDTYKDMFIGCCRSCEVLDKIKWLIALKSQMVTLTKQALIKKNVFLNYGENLLLSNTLYFMAQENGINIATCESSTYELIPVLLGNRVGFIGASDRLSWESLLLRSHAPKRKNDVGDMGWYTSAIANKYKRNRCANSYASISYNDCVVYVLSTKLYGFECCCYGSQIARCQERIGNAIVTGLNLAINRERKKVCIIDEDSVNPITVVNFSSNGITFRGDVYNLMNDMEKETNSSSPQNSRSSGMEQIEENKELINQYMNVTQSFQCINLSTWDARAHDIFRFRCAQLLRRTAAKSVPKFCEYNNEYQYFLHDYFHPVRLGTNHSCLLHFVTKNALRDMKRLLPGESSVIFFMPGSAIQPIDFSYALLKVDTCDYLDVDLNYDYLRTRYCYESTELLKHFETKYMPMRLFACRCKTRPGDAPCDKILMKNIAKMAEESQLNKFVSSDIPNPDISESQFLMMLNLDYLLHNFRDRKYYCGAYDDAHTILFNQKPRFSVNDLSSYCTTMLDFQIIGNNIEYVFSGGIARRTLVNKVKFSLAAIPYAMNLLTGETTQLCMHLVMGKMILCFCHNKYEDRKKPCNLNPYEKSKALQLAIYELSQSKVLFIIGEQKDTVIISECMKGAVKFEGELGQRANCAEKILYEECGIISESNETSDNDEENLVCCCVDNCDSVGLQLQEFDAEVRFLMESDNQTY